MCSPELWNGICCICCGDLRPDNTLHEDLNEGRGGVHRGLCAVLAGIYEDPAHEAVGDALIKVAHSMEYNSPEHKLMYRVYYAFANMVSGENHYDMSGPGDDSEDRA